MEVDHVQTTARTELPTEIIFMITSHLSPVDVACLALCNHRLLSILRRGVWDTLDTIPRDRELFLKWLDRDLPSHFFCYICSILHFKDYINPPGPLFRPNRTYHLHAGAVPTISQFLRVHPRYPSEYIFKIFHLQLAMQRHYYGPNHGISTDSLLFTEVNFDPRTSATTLLSVEARICDGPCLGLRIQNWALVGARTIGRLIFKTKFISICGHADMISEKAILPTLMRSAFAKFNVSSQDGIPAEPDIFTCRACDTDYQVKIKVTGKNKPALVITKWLNLGAGLDPNDIRWKRHSETQVSIDSKAVRSSGETVSLFESAEGPSLDCITQENEPYLLNDHYKESLDGWGLNAWILQGGKSIYPHPLVRKMADLIIDVLLLWPWWIGAVVTALMAYVYLSR